MARSNVARAESIVTLNGKAAENALDGLKLKAKEYRDAIIEASKAGDTKQVNKLSTELKSIEATTKKLRQETFNYNSILKNLNGSTITQLEKAAKSLRNEIKGLTPDTQLFITKSKQLDQVRNRLDALNGRVRENNNWLSRAGNSFNKYFGLATTAIASVTGISFALRGAAQEAAKMDDIYADVMKTTGLTRDEVVLLNDEFKKLNTRTSREELNKLAREAGKLGISGSEDVLAFVKAANKINVALREDLGEDAVLNIGKISEVFKLTKEMGIEKSYASIGSAINALGQDSSAAEQYLVDFTKRVAGSSYQAGISLQNILGYASALDQSGAQVEMSATAFQNFLMKMYSETDTMAKIAGVDVKAFSKLLSEDANAAIIKVLTGLNSKGGFAQMVPLFQEMGGEGARFVSVLSSLGTNINLVTEAQKLSHVEFAKATSLQNEYNIKNETMQAKLDKAKKSFQDQVIILGEKLSPAFLKSTNATTLFLKAIMAIDKEFLYAAVVFAGAIIAYKSWNVVVATGNAIMGAARIVSLAFSSGIALVQGNTVRAAAAWKMFNASLSASTIGIAVTAITALGYGIYKVLTYQTALEKAQNSVNKEFGKASLVAYSLFDALSKSTKGSAEYKAILGKINEAYSPFLANMIDEEGNLTDIAQARNAVIIGLKEEISLKIRNQSIEKVMSDSMDKQVGLYERFVGASKEKGGEEVARIRADVLTSMVREGQSMTEIMKKMAEYGLDKFQIPKSVILQYKQEYDKMVKDVNSIENTIKSITDKSIIGPVLDPTKVKNKDKVVPDNDETETEKQRKKREAAFKKELDALDKKERATANILKEAYANKAISQDAFEAMSLQNTIDFLQKRNQLYIDNNQDNTTVEGQYFDALVQLSERAVKQVEEKAKIAESWRKKIREVLDKENEDIYAEENTKEWNKLSQGILKRQEDLEKSAADIKLRYATNTWKKKRKIEMDNLNEMLRQGLITQKEYEQAIEDMRMEAAVKIAQAVNSLVQAAADLYNTIRDAEFDRLERQKEQELRLYGDNADARAEIEQKYEKEKLKLQIEYADKDMAVKIVQSLAAGALAVVQAFAQLGPVAGAIAAVLIGATTAVQITTIVAQRNALKANLSSGGGGGSGASRSVKGYSDGGYTGRSHSDREAVGVVHANEWVAPAAMVRSNPIVFNNLERERVNKYSILSPPKQFATGGFTSPSKGSSNTDALLVELIQEFRELKSKSLRAHVVLSDVNAQQEVSNRFKEVGSL